jgi:hypothetical protein
MADKGCPNFKFFEIDKNWDCHLSSMSAEVTSLIRNGNFSA